MAKDPGDRQATCGELVDEARTALGLIQRESLTRRRVAIVALLAAALAAAAATGVLLATRGDAPLPAGSGGALVRIDPGTNEVTASYAVSANPGVVTATRNRVWLGDFRDGSLWRLDPAGGTSIGSRRPVNRAT